MKTIFAAALLVLSLAACSSPTEDAHATSSAQTTCPAGQRAVIGWGGNTHCVLPHGDFTNVTAECAPQAIQAYYDFWKYDRGGEGALSCAAAGEAICQDDKTEYDLDMADVKAAGFDCPFVR